MLRFNQGRYIPHGSKLLTAFDAVSEGTSSQNIAQVLDAYGKITFVLLGEFQDIPPTATKTITLVGAVHGNPIAGSAEDLSDFGYAWFRLFGLGRKEGWFTGHPYEVIPGWLNGVQTGLQNLKAGKGGEEQVA
ncbi:hypothetical protein CLCR_01724 [Cladophialophora carrionii]|uniref:Uncharacterized protein n=1 Tax=Cladophialophora carrionii TaxID=86049 RepID=A0A1C1CBK7_9EURO|nr:hypothetical protein CLCR_01724 [Cladophialophora carrionii]